MIKILSKYIKDVDIKELILKSSSFFFIKVFGALSAYGFILLVTRLYGAGVQGLVSIYFSVFLIGSLIPRMGFDINLVKTFSSQTLGEAKYVYRKTLKLSLILSVIMGAICFFLRDFLASAFGFDSSLYIVYGAISIPLWTMIAINSAALRGLRDIKQMAFIKNMARFFFGVIFFVVGFYLLGFKEKFIPGLAHTIGLLALCIYSFYWVNRYLGAQKSERGDFKLNAYIRSSLPMLFSVGIMLFLSWTDTIFIGIYRSKTEVGIFNTVLKIATVVVFSVHAIDSILAPKLAKAYAEKNRHAFKKLIQLAAKINFCFAVIVLLSIIVFRDFILGLFGPEFIVGDTLLILLCIGQFINAFCGPTGAVFEMTGHQKIFRNLVFIAFLVNLILDFFLVKPYGYYGAAISSIVGVSTWNILAAVFAWRKFKVRIFFYPF